MCVCLLNNWVAHKPTTPKLLQCLNPHFVFVGGQEHQIQTQNVEQRRRWQLPFHRKDQSTDQSRFSLPISLWKGFFFFLTSYFWLMFGFQESENGYVMCFFPFHFVAVVYLFLSWILITHLNLISKHLSQMFQIHCYSSKFSRRVDFFIWAMILIFIRFVAQQGWYVGPFWCSVLGRTVRGSTTSVDTFISIKGHFHTMSGEKSLRLLEHLYERIYW